MLAVKVHKRDAERTRRLLIELGVLAKGYEIKGEGDYILFPVTEAIAGFETIDADFKRIKVRPHSYKEVVEIPGELRKLLPSSFDVIGDIAIVELPEELKPYGRRIGEAILRVHRHIKAVFAKGGKVEGEYRVRQLVHLAGERRTETVHRENGIRLKLDVAKVYYSPRLATERMRIYRRAKRNEVVFDMFSGVGPYAVLLARKVRLVFACDLNPWAIHYLEKNVKLNRTGNVVPLFGDVRKFAGKVKADRIIMNLPRYADRFLGDAMKSVRAGGVIHYYGFGPEEDPFSEHEEKIRAAAKELNLQVEIIERRKVRGYAPRQLNVAIDFTVYRR